MFENLKEKQEQKKLEQQKRMQAEMQRKQEEKQILADLAVAQAELNELKKEHGLMEEEKGLKKAITKYFDKRDARVKHPVKKKTYLWLGLLGIFGAHRFYAKHYVLGVVYLLLCWTGISITMTIIDMMEVAPMEADENGCIML